MGIKATEAMAITITTMRITIRLTVTKIFRRCATTNRDQRDVLPPRRT
jgi:hypothetical protein